MPYENLSDEELCKEIKEMEERGFAGVNNSRMLIHSRPAAVKIISKLAAAARARRLSILK